MDDQEADSRQVTRRRDDEGRKLHPLAGIGKRVQVAPPIPAVRGQTELLDRPNNPIVRLDRPEARR
jgi:hypothetical protein